RLPGDAQTLAEVGAIGFGGEATLHGVQQRNGCGQRRQRDRRGDEQFDDRIAGRARHRALRVRTSAIRVSAYARRAPVRVPMCATETWTLSVSVASVAIDQRRTNCGPAGAGGPPSDRPAAST